MAQQLTDNQLVGKLGAVLQLALNYVQAQQRPDYGQSYFVYTIPVLAVAAGATTSASFSVPSVYDFQVEAMIAIDSVSEGDLTKAPKGRIQISGAGGNSNWFSNNTPISAVFGPNAAHPYVLPVPRLIARASNLVLDVTSGEAAQADFYFMFLGQQLQPIS